MWDYGYLWQITVWPEDYNAAERAMAAKYFRHDLVRGPVRMEAGDDRVFFDNAKPLPVSQKREGAERNAATMRCASSATRCRRTSCAGGSTSWSRARRSSSASPSRPGGEPIRFAGDAGPQAQLISDLFQAHLALYAPAGSGPGKGALDLVGCENVIVRGCRLSALGDTMHIQKSRGVIFADNHITGSRMGAFFLAEYLQGRDHHRQHRGRHERLARDERREVVRGRDDHRQHLPQRRPRLLDQPAAQLRAGRQHLREQHDQVRTRPAPRAPQLRHRRLRALRRAVLHHPRAGGRYGNVIVRGNIFTSGPKPTHAITFAPGGDTILVADKSSAARCATSLRRTAART